MRNWLFCATLIALSPKVSAQVKEELIKNASTLANQWDALLKTHVHSTSGRVDYIGLEKDREKLEQFIAAYDGLDLKNLNDNFKKSLFINLYNAAMMKNILRYAKENNIAVSSAKFTALKVNELSVKGGNIWNGSYTVRLSGTDVTLDDIEHNLIRGQAQKPPLSTLKVGNLDPRIHAAVNCAALSCPRVREKAYRPENIDVMLDENMREFFGSELQFKKVDKVKLKANSIILWYYDDFDSYAKNKLKLRGAGDWIAGNFIAKDRPDAVWMKEHLESNFNDRSKIALRLTGAFSFEYDWKINDIRN